MKFEDDLIIILSCSFMKVKKAEKLSKKFKVNEARTSAVTYKLVFLNPPKLRNI